MSNPAFNSQSLIVGENMLPDQIDQHGAEALQDAPAHQENHERARPIPRISILAFCEQPITAQVVQGASEDRRLAKAHVGVHMGGIYAAIAHFQENPTPNLVILESMLDRNSMLAALDQLSESCDAGTKVIVVGHSNDVLLYRELLRRGVSEYLVAPVSPLYLMESISNLYADPESDPVGHMVAFVGAKGGVGSSTVCHNTAWVMSRIMQSNVCIADLDLPFGTAGLDFNQDPAQGIYDALSSPERLDEVLLDRLLAKCTDHLSLFAAPSVLDRNFEIDPQSYEWVLDVVRQNVPHVAIDVPHVWTPWCKQVLMQADQVVITAVPDLANLRNAKNLVDLLKTTRKNDRPPHLVLNTMGMPKRPEISIKEFGEALGLLPRVAIEFDAELFGLAANNGQMVEELSAKSKAAEHFRSLAYALTNQAAPKVEQKSMLAPLLKRFNLSRAGA
jgi:pilus assembly protein CpaE